MTERLRPLISAGQIRQRVAELAQQISEDHRGEPLTLVIVLKGATVFAADLMRRIETPFVIDFVRASSYGKTARSSGKVVLGDEAQLDIAGHHVIVVEDIVDSGLTITALIAALEKLGPASLDVCALLHKHVAGARHRDPLQRLRHSGRIRRRLRHGLRRALPQPAGRLPELECSATS